MLDDLSMMLSWMNLSIDLKSWTPVHARGSNFDIFMPCKKVYASSWTTPTVYDDKKKVVSFLTCWLKCKAAMLKTTLNTACNIQANREVYLNMMKK